MPKRRRTSREQEYRQQSRRERFSNPHGIYSRYRPDQEQISYDSPFEAEQNQRSFSGYEDEDHQDFTTHYNRSYDSSRRPHRDTFNDGPDYSGRGPKGYTRSDERILESVCERLTHDPYVDASEIDVSVKEGIVTLEGHVDSRKSKRRAEDAVDTLPGVKDVHNRIEIDQSFFERMKEKAKEFISSQAAGPIPPRTPQSESVPSDKH